MPHFLFLLIRPLWSRVHFNDFDHIISGACEAGHYYYYLTNFVFSFVWFPHKFCSAKFCSTLFGVDRPMRCQNMRLLQGIKTSCDFYKRSEFCNSRYESSIRPKSASYTNLAFWPIKTLWGELHPGCSHLPKNGQSLKLAPIWPCAISKHL